MSIKTINHQIKLILSEYEIGELLSVEQLHLGYVNLSYKIKTSTKMNNGKFFLRKYNNSNEKDIIFQHSILKHLYKKKFNLVPELIKTKEGKTYVEGITNKGESNYFSIFEYLRGEDRYTWVNPRCSEVDLKQTAIVLAKYHNAIYDLVPNGKSTEPVILDLLPKIDILISRYANNAGITIFDDYFLENSQLLQESIEQRNSEINKVDHSNLLRLIIHGDFHPGNLKFLNEEVIGLFDFDWAKLDFRSFDVGLAIMYFCTAWERERDGDLDLKKAAIFLAVYQKTLKEMNCLKPMSKPELDFLSHMISASNIYILYWTISDFYSKNADPSVYLTFLEHGICGVNWFSKEDNWYKLKEMIKNSG